MGEKAAAWITTNLMTEKQFFGSGLHKNFLYNKRKILYNKRKNYLYNESMNYLKSLPIPLKDEEDRKNDQGDRKNNYQIRKNDQEGRKKNHQGRKKNHQGRKKDQLNYVMRHVHLTEDLLKQIAEGFSREKSVKLSFSLIRKKDSAQNEQKLPLTRYQIKKINKGEEITLSVK